jgi:hypothetical protein
MCIFGALLYSIGIYMNAGIKAFLLKCLASKKAIDSVYQAFIWNRHCYIILNVLVRLIGRQHVATNIKEMNTLRNFSQDAPVKGS